MPEDEAWISQMFSVPSCPRPMLSYWYLIHSQDKLENDKYDSFDVLIDGKLIWRDGNTEWNNPSCGPLPWSSGWVRKTHSLSGYTGQNIVLSFYNVNRADRWFNTWTYVDDVEVYCAP